MEAGATVAPSYKGGGQGRTRPDSSRRPMGRSLIPEKNVVEERPSSLPSLCPSHIVSFPVSLLSAFASCRDPRAKGWRRGRFSLEPMEGCDGGLPTSGWFQQICIFVGRRFDPRSAVRTSVQSHLTRETQEALTARETRSSPTPANQESTLPSRRPITRSTWSRWNRKPPTCQSKCCRRRHHLDPHVSSTPPDQT